MKTKAIRHLAVGDVVRGTKKGDDWFEVLQIDNYTFQYHIFLRYLEGDEKGKLGTIKVGQDCKHSLDEDLELRTTDFDKN